MASSCRDSKKRTARQDSAAQEKTAAGPPWQADASDRATARPPTTERRARPCAPGGGPTPDPVLVDAIPKIRAARQEAVAAATVSRPMAAPLAATAPCPAGALLRASARESGFSPRAAARGAPPTVDLCEPAAETGVPAPLERQLAKDRPRRRGLAVTTTRRRPSQHTASAARRREKIDAAAHWPYTTASHAPPRAARWLPRQTAARPRGDRYRDAPPAPHAATRWRKRRRGTRWARGSVASPARQHAARERWKRRRTPARRWIAGRAPRKGRRRGLGGGAWVNRVWVNREGGACDRSPLAAAGCPPRAAGGR
jgi:hypothetical protein